MQCAGLVGKFVGLPRRVGRLLHGSGEFLGRCGCLFEARRLVLRALRKIARAGGDLRCRTVDVARRTLDRRDRLRQAAHGIVDAIGELGEASFVVAVHPHDQIAISHLVQCRGEILHGFLDDSIDAILSDSQIAQRTDLVVLADTPGEIALGGRIDDAGDFVDRAKFGRDIMPFGDLCQ